MNRGALRANVVCLVFSRDHAGHSARELSPGRGRVLVFASVSQLLLAPAQDQFTRFMKLKTYWGIGDFPYVMVVHGSHDKTVPLDDSIRLIETSEVGRCRLEVVGKLQLSWCLGDRRVTARSQAALPV